MAKKIKWSSHKDDGCTVIVARSNYAGGKEYMTAFAISHRQWRYGNRPAIFERVIQQMTAVMAEVSE